MEIGTGKSLSRRTALGGMGAAMALPLVGSAGSASSRIVEGKVALANVYAFLASDESSYITGQTFHVNGGRLRY